MKQNEYSKSTLKCWSNRRPKAESRWARPKTEHQQPTKFIESFYLGRTYRRAIKEKERAAAKLSTMIGLTIKHAVCLIIIIVNRT